MLNFAKDIEQEKIVTKSFKNKVVRHFRDFCRQLKFSPKLLGIFVNLRHFAFSRKLNNCCSFHFRTLAFNQQKMWVTPELLRRFTSGSLMWALSFLSWSQWRKMSARAQKAITRGRMPTTRQPAQKLILRVTFDTHSTGSSLICQNLLSLHPGLNKQAFLCPFPL